MRTLLPPYLGIPLSIGAAASKVLWDLVVERIECELLVWKSK